MKELQNKFPKNTLFWKYMIVALQAMEQEYELYERLAKDRQFDMTRHLKKTMERFYQAAATGYQPDEKYLLAVEESYFEPRDEYEKLALRIVGDLDDFFHVVYEKNCKKAGSFLERPLELLEQFYSFSPNIDLDQAKEEERNYLSQLIEEAVAVDKKDKKAYIATVKSRERTLLIGDALLENRVLCKEGLSIKEKAIKKVFPLIRRTSLRYDYDLEKYRDMPADTPWRISENWEEIQAGWYLNVLETLYNLELFEYGYPVEGNKSFYHERHIEAKISSSMIRAYAVGAKELIPRLFYYSYDKSSRNIYDLLCGSAVKGQFPDPEDEGFFSMGVQALLEGNGAEFTKALLKRVRYIRGWYNLYGISSDEWGYALVRLAEERGLEYEKVVAVELLDCEARQLELSKIRLKDQDEKDSWLEEAKEKHFKLDKMFPYIPEGKTVRRPDTTLDTIAYLIVSEQDDLYQLCRNLDHRALYEYAEKLIADGKRLSVGHAVRAYAHMQLYREQYNWEQVNEDLSQAIAYSDKDRSTLSNRNLKVMACRARALIHPDKESEQYRQDIEFLRDADENKGWYYKGHK